MQAVLPFPDDENARLLTSEIENLLDRMDRIAKPSLSRMRSLLEIVDKPSGAIIIVEETYESPAWSKPITTSASPHLSLISVNMVDLAAHLAPALHAMHKGAHIAIELNRNGFFATSKAGPILHAGLPSGASDTGHDAMTTFTEFLAWASARLG